MKNSKTISILLGLLSAISSFAFTTFTDSTIVIKKQIGDTLYLFEEHGDSLFRDLTILKVQRSSSSGYDTILVYETQLSGATGWEGDYDISCATWKIRGHKLIIYDYDETTDDCEGEHLEIPSFDACKKVIDLYDCEPGYDGLQHQASIDGRISRPFLHWKIKRKTKDLFKAMYADRKDIYGW